MQRREKRCSPAFLPLAPCHLHRLSHAHGGVGADAGEEGEFCQKVQGLFVIFGQCGMERKAGKADEAGALVFLQIDLLRFDLRVREMNAFDEVLHVVEREREGRGELPFVEQVAEDVTRHGQGERLFVFDEAGGGMKTKREAVRERAGLGFARDGLRELGEVGLRGPGVLVEREQGRSGHEAAVVGLGPGFLLCEGSAHALEEVFFHGGEAEPRGLAFFEFEARALWREVALQVGDGIGSRVIGIVQLRDELGVVAFEPAQERGVENASGVERHGGVLRGGEGEDD